MKAPSRRKSRAPRAHRLRTLLHAALAAPFALGFLAAPGCGSGSSSGKKKPAVEKTLNVTRMTPPDRALDVPSDVTIEVEFSESVDFATIDPASFSVEGTASGVVTGLYDRPGPRLVSFKGSSPYEKGETVRVELTSDLRTETGERLEPAAFSFTVVPPPPPPDDPDPPAPLLSVESSSPAPNDANVPSDKVITVLFAEPLDPFTLTASSIIVSSDARGRIAAPVLLEDGNRRLSIRPEDPLPAGSLVETSISAAIRGAGGTAFTGETFRFRVKAEAPPKERKLDRVFSALGRVRRLAAADMNGDRLSDVIYASENETVFDVLLSKGDGTYIPALRIDVGQPVLCLTAVDWDEDGDLDVLMGAADRVSVYWNRSEEDGSPPAAIRFESGPQAPVTGAVRSLAAGDLDHRGPPDAVLDTDRGIQILLGGLGTPKQVLGDDRQSRTPIVLADLDLDGHLDLVFGDRRGARVSYYLAEISDSGEFSFTGPGHIALGTDADQLAVENLRGDALPEILVLIAGAASTQGAAFRIIHQTPGGLQVDGPPAAAAGADLDAGSFALGDLDGNGEADVILAAAGPGKVFWFPNRNGTIDFAAPGLEVLDTPEAWLVAAADVTGDGSLDVLSAGLGEIHTLLPKEEEPPPPPPEDEFELSIDSTEARRKDTGASALIKLTSTKALQGYSAVIGYDPSAIVPKSASIEGTATAAAGAEFTNFRVFEGEPAAVFSVILDFEAPLDGKTLPAGENQLLFRLAFDVPEAAPLGPSVLTFLERAGDPPVLTELVVAGASVTPETRPGDIEILPPKDPEPTGPNILKIEPLVLAPGEEGSVRILASVEKPVEAFTTIVAYDRAVLEALSFDLAGSVSESLAPELVVPSIRASEGFAMFTVIFDFVPPFDRQTIPAGRDMRIVTLQVRALPNAALGTYPIRLENGLGDPPLNNIFVVDGQSVFPELVSGELRIGERTQPTFIRGDFNDTLSVDMSDAVAIVAFLFRSGPGPSCEDAADANDSGSINLTDSVFLLDHLFRGKSPPPAPFPDAGPDPTADELLCGD